jgi:hypothetical protein
MTCQHKCCHQKYCSQFFYFFIFFIFMNIHFFIRDTLNSFEVLIFTSNMYWNLNARPYGNGSAKLFTIYLFFLK